jgi:predicted DNA-binding transcriptional regulator AlpA
MRLLSYAELHAVKGIQGTRQTIWRKVRAGKFPPPVKDGARNGWIDEEIDRHIEAMRAERDADSAVKEA